MVAYSDSIAHAERLFPFAQESWSPAARVASDVQDLVALLYDKRGLYRSKMESDPLWNYLFLVESSPRSQLDLLVELARQGSAPDGVLCLAGTGGEFHGFKNRPWSACPGNLHLSAHLTPERSIPHFGTGFTILLAVSAVEAIDSLPGLEGRAGIKWVNDILIDGAKVCGVLAYTQAMQEMVGSAVLGIGLNVETTPSVEPTPYVPRVAALREFAPEPTECRQGTVLEELLHALGRNYRLLLQRGYNSLLARYRERSLVTGREVTICSDDSGADPEVIAAGRVTGLGEDLELFIEGRNEPVSRGRLILHREG